MQPLPRVVEVWRRLSPPLGLGASPRLLNFEKEKRAMLGTILIVFLILALVGAFPRWSHSRDWGYLPTGGVSLVLLVVVVLVLIGRI
jgi:hypothetical protein